MAALDVFSAEAYKGLEEARIPLGYVRWFRYKTSPTLHRS